MKWRRAMVVLASAGGNDVVAIARLVQASPDRVREMIHRFNDLGMRSLDPQWAGGRPRQITTTDRALIVKTAKTRRPNWVNRSRTGRCASSPTTSGPTGPPGDGRAGTVTADPDRRGDHVPADQDLEGIAGSVERTEAGADRVAARTCRERTFAFDEFGPLTIKPVAGSAWSPRRQTATVASQLQQAARVKTALRLVLDRRRPTVREPRAVAKVRHRRCGRLQAIRASVNDGRPIHVILDNLNHHKNRDVRDWCAANGVELVFTPTYAVMGQPDRGPLRAATPVRHRQQRPRNHPASAERSATTCAGATPIPATRKSSKPNAATEPTSEAKQQRRWGHPTSRRITRERMWSEH